MSVEESQLWEEGRTVHAEEERWGCVAALLSVSFGAHGKFTSVHSLYCAQGLLSPALQRLFPLFGNRRCN